MTTIQMLQSRMGTEDGFNVRQFQEGCTYDVRDNLACEFITKEWAVETQESRQHRIAELEIALEASKQPSIPYDSKLLY